MKGTPDQRAAYDREYRQKNKERIAAYHRSVRSKKAAQERARYHNSPKRKAQNAAKRALKRKASVNLKGILNFMRRTKAKRFVTCYYCNHRVSSKEIHFDHIVALSKGGAHSVENLCVSCSACNLAKHNKPVEAWVRIGQQILAL